jgi:hypothetical protein
MFTPRAHAACSCCMSTFHLPCMSITHVHFTCQCWRSTLHVHGACLCSLTVY